jgi:hypothetical protein
MIWACDYDGRDNECKENDHLKDLQREEDGRYLEVTEDSDQWRVLVLAMLMLWLLLPLPVIS